MLRELLYRDWKLHRTHVLLILAMFVAFQLYFVLRVDSPRLWVAATCIFMAFQTITPFTREDKFQSAGWTCTLPVSRRAVVQSRWLESWLLVLIGLALALVMGLLLPGSRADLSRVLVPDTLLLAAAIVSLILTALLPFTIRWGLTGVMIFLVGAQIAGAALLFATVMLGAGKGLHTVIEGTRGALLSLQALLTPAVFHVTAALALVLLNWLGYRAALALYRRREF